MTVIKHRDFIHCYGARDPGKHEQALRNQVAAIDRKPITPGHFNSTLGFTVAASTKPGVNMSMAKRKARVTLAKVW